MAFMRKFLAATQDKRVNVSRSIGQAMTEMRLYMNVRFTDKAQRFVDSIDQFTEDIF